MNWKTLTAVGLALMALTVAACGGDGDTPSPSGIEVRGTSYSFDPAELTVQAGEEVTVRFRNTDTGDTLHNWVVLGAEGGIFTGKLLPGEEQSVTFTIEQPGTYTIICEVTPPNHRERGMEGTLIVQ